MTSFLFFLIASFPAAHYQPASATVGDPVTITFRHAPTRIVSVTPAAEYDVLKLDRNSAVVRPLRPGTIKVRGQLLGSDQKVYGWSSTILIRSVLEKDDALEPAPLRPPRPLPANRTATVFLICSAVLAAALWTAVILRARKPAAVPSVELRSSREVFLEEVNAASRLTSDRQRAVALSDATRKFLTTSGMHVGRHLTSTEVRRVLGSDGESEGVRTVSEVLRAGDFAKFSPGDKTFHLPPDLFERSSRSVPLLSRDREIADASENRGTE